MAGPNDPQPASNTALRHARNVAIIAAIAAAVNYSVPITQTFEGYSGRAYRDPAHVLTQCYGETQDIDPSLIYSKSQCATKLRKRLAEDYAPKILKCVPSLITHHRAFGAALDAAYNAGPAGFCKSPMAQAFNAGNYARGCAAFRGWRITATDRRTGVRVTYPGLARRRIDEMKLCQQPEEIT